MVNMNNFGGTLKVNYGVISKGTLPPPNSVILHITEKKKKSCKFPLDGDWILS